jgi:hypothetical protein
MTQEVEITLTTELDAELSKEEIAYLVQTVLNQSPYRRELIFKVKQVREEAEIYGNTDEIIK